MVKTIMLFWCSRFLAFKLKFYLNFSILKPLDLHDLILIACLVSDELHDLASQQPKLKFRRMGFELLTELGDVVDDPESLIFPHLGEAIDSM
jgi:hypothetical protein